MSEKLEFILETGRTTVIVDEDKIMREIRSGRFSTVYEEFRTALRCLKNSTTFCNDVIENEELLYYLLRLEGLDNQILAADSGSSRTDNPAQQIRSMYLFQSDILDIEKSLARIKTSKKRDSNREERIEESLKKIMGHNYRFLMKNYTKVDNQGIRGVSLEKLLRLEESEENKEKELSKDVDNRPYLLPSKTLPLAQALGIFYLALRKDQFYQEHGFLHSDISPDNTTVYYKDIASEGESKLFRDYSREINIVDIDFIDWGLAREIGVDLRDLLSGVEPVMKGKVTSYYDAGGKDSPVPICGRESAGIEMIIGNDDGSKDTKASPAHNIYQISNLLVRMLTGYHATFLTGDFLRIEVRDYHAALEVYESAGKKEKKKHKPKLDRAIARIKEGVELIKEHYSGIVSDEYAKTISDKIWGEDYSGLLIDLEELKNNHYESLLENLFRQKLDNEGVDVSDDKIGKVVNIMHKGTAEYGERYQTNTEIISAVNKLEEGGNLRDHKYPSHLISDLDDNSNDNISHEPDVSSSEFRLDTTTLDSVIGGSSIPKTSITKDDDEEEDTLFPYGLDVPVDRSGTIKAGVAGGLLGIIGAGLIALFSALSPMVCPGMNYDAHDITEETRIVDTYQDTKDIHTPDTKDVHTPDTSDVHTPDTSDVIEDTTPEDVPLKEVLDSHTPDSIPIDTHDIKPDQIEPDAVDVIPDRVIPDAVDIIPDRVIPDAVDVKPDDVKDIVDIVEDKVDVPTPPKPIPPVPTPELCKLVSHSVERAHVSKKIKINARGLGKNCFPNQYDNASANGNNNIKASYDPETRTITISPDQESSTLPFIGKSYFTMNINGKTKRYNIEFYNEAPTAINQKLVEVKEDRSLKIPWSQLFKDSDSRLSDFSLGGVKSVGDDKEIKDEKTKDLIEIVQTSSGIKITTTQLDKHTPQEPGTSSYKKGTLAEVEITAEDENFLVRNKIKIAVKPVNDCPRVVGSRTEGKNIVYIPKSSKGKFAVEGLFFDPENIHALTISSDTKGVSVKQKEKEDYSVFFVHNSGAGLDEKLLVGLTASDDSTEECQIEKEGKMVSAYEATSQVAVYFHHWEEFELSKDYYIRARFLNTYLASGNMSSSNSCTGYALGLDILGEVLKKLRYKAERAGTEKNSTDAFSQVVGYLMYSKKGTYQGQNSRFKKVKEHNEEPVEEGMLVDVEIRGSDSAKKETERYLSRGMSFGKILHIGDLGNICIQAELRKR